MDELASSRLVQPGQVPELANDRLAHRIGACLEAAAAGALVSLDNGYPVC